MKNGQFLLLQKEKGFQREKMARAKQGQKYGWKAKQVNSLDAEKVCGAKRGKLGGGTSDYKR